MFAKKLKNSMKNKKEIIVTGGSGFLGTSLINSLQNNFKIISVDRKKSNLKKENLFFYKGKLKNFLSKHNLNNVKAIIHLATSESRALMFQKKPILANKNIDDMIYLLEKVKKSKKKIILIFASSRDVEKKYKRSIKDLYSFSKEYSENLIKIYSIDAKFIFYIVRIPDLYDYEISKNPKKKALYKIYTRLSKSQDLSITNPKHDFEYISRTLVSKKITDLLSKKNHKNTILSLNGEKINILKLVKKIMNKYNIKSRIQLIKKVNKLNYKFKSYKLEKKLFFFNNLKNIT